MKGYVGLLVGVNAYGGVIAPPFLPAPQFMPLGDGDAPILPGLPSRNELLSQPPTHHDTNPHGFIPITAATDPAGPNNFLAAALLCQPNPGNFLCSILALDKMLENVDPDIRQLILANLQEYLLLPFFNGGKEMFGRFMKDILEHVRTSLSDITPFDLGQEDDKYSNGPSTYAPPFTVGLHVHNPAKRELIKALALVASNTDYAYSIEDPTYMITAPPACVLVDQASSRTDQRPLNNCLLNLARTIDVRIDEVKGMLVVYARPATPIPSAWEPTANLIAVTAFQSRYIKFYPALYPSDVSGPRCVKCKRECHIVHGCPFVVTRTDSPVAETVADRPETAGAEAVGVATMPTPPTAEAPAVEATTTMGEEGMLVGQETGEGLRVAGMELSHNGLVPAVPQRQGLFRPGSAGQQS
ncbi:hypothetical protein DFH07DRAFT_948516 [Mycena maculata]|uniref:Uncharacterized protein n=1 Tax=Mycena maculata TaxID=230809 RepID=A0AAD7P0Z6_9AGAR|nr:hypothetical protein DFH07DRAFT_948516 [Mycena maculata]